MEYTILLQMPYPNGTGKKLISSRTYDFMVQDTLRGGELYSILMPVDNLGRDHINKTLQSSVCNELNKNIK